MIRFSHMCDRCFRVLGDHEDMYGFKLIDDEGVERVFQGHESCVIDMEQIIIQLYAPKEKKKDE